MLLMTRNLFDVISEEEVSDAAFHPTDGIKRNRKKVDPLGLMERSIRNEVQLNDSLVWLKSGFRRISVSHERLDVCFIGFVFLASFLIIWRMI